MLAWVEEGNAVNQESEILFRYMGKNPGWNEKNFQVRYLLIVAKSLG